ncbi:unnamed protein product, partial [Mesorhabditis belari]|uniref:Uncharacterized protein n=1 Tax=Mesorhabditis belari TaxID=2138241 RepID=A0AAF3FI82_9BILA
MLAPPFPSTRKAATLFLSITVSLLISLLEFPKGIMAIASPDYMTDYSLSSKYCYSCMSESFLIHWAYLDEVYYRPLNFTDHCYSIPSKVSIGMVPCSHSMCVTVIEPRILAGQHVGNNIIRGCFSSVFKYGATPRTQPSHASDTSCTRMPANRLLPPHLAARSSNRSVELCWCMGQLCNDYPSVPINQANRYSLPFLISLMVFLFLLLR